MPRSVYGQATTRQTFHLVLVLHMKHARKKIAGPLRSRRLCDVVENAWIGRIGNAKNKI